MRVTFALFFVALQACATFTPNIIKTGETDDSITLTFKMNGFTNTDRAAEMTDAMGRQKCGNRGYDIHDVGSSAESFTMNRTRRRDESVQLTDTYGNRYTGTVERTTSEPTTHYYTQVRMKIQCKTTSTVH